LVSIRNGNDQARFETEMKNQMAALGVNGRITVGRRRTFEVHSKQVVGYSLMVSELTAGESIALHESGLGGRRKMGCGFFEPWEA
ncbi:MAG TPA: type I-MYXAN CRISPR-associated protein Cas6/Cmx6, partial [Syntrophobacteraceae bacterium]|nr:type I-MYXAN CRISPR-associated protein Cas6/Cmx6 [Syntrophobacteraceae bacterium]